MKIEQLERFLVVARCLNFTTAAEQLYVGQSTISRQIAALEDEFGVPLLIRGPRSVELTDAGRTLQREGIKLLEYIDQIKGRVQQAGNGATGRLRILSIPAYIPILSKIQEKVVEVYPNLQLTFGQCGYDQIAHQLEVGAADVGITFSIWDHMDPAYERMALMDEHFCVLCSRKHWVAEKEDTGVYLDELKDQDFYFGRDGIHLARHPLDFQDSTVVNSRVNQFSSLEDMLMQLSVSSGIVVLPSVVARTLQNNLACVPVLDEDLSHKLVMLWRRDNGSPTLSRFLEIVHSCLEQENET
jgi:DNA-binding transcriptional LysR family regulator